MKRSITVILSLIILIVQSIDCFANNIAEQCQNNTVVIPNGYGHVSGVLFTRTNIDDVNVTFIWSVGHVANMVMKPNGSFHELTIIQGDKYAKAIVLRASDFEIEHDIALLMVINSNDFHGDAKFYRAFNHVTVGHKIVHVGTPLNRIHECSVFNGIISYVNREYNIQPVLASRFVDQVNMTCLPGSSGGGIFDDETGGILGLVSLGSAETIGFITPTRYIYEWAKSHDCLWAFDREVPLPIDIIPWRSDLYTRIIANRNYSDVDARWGEPELIDNFEE